MFGMGLGEILLIAIVAILFLGPDKLPGTMVEIAKFFRSVKSTVSNAKASLEEEMKLGELKEEVLNYKQELTNASAELERMASVTEIGSEISSIQSDLNFNPMEAKSTSTITQAAQEPELITFAPKVKSTDQENI